ncbi:MAG: acyl-CoA dehydrogenase family protein [Bryobacter sp.]|jgi:butyryl-CoA dehydrogenase/short/branched chain acyl-CoA dehydrogenase|nr:acyl-CoA dehydrogenase family protein [Bryobacter sp. CoA8 C33]
MGADMQPLSVLSEEESEFRDLVRDFARAEIAPLVRRMDDEAKLDAALLRQLFAQGFMGIDIAEEYGGQGGSFFDSVLLIEELAVVDPSVSVCVDVQNTLVNNAIRHWGTPAQKRQWLPQLARDTVGSYALSEAGAGSDAFSLTTTATAAADGWVLNGQKLWITNAAEAGLFLVFATIDRSLGHRGIACFLVPRSAPGLTLGKKEDKLGIRASSTCELNLAGVTVTEADLLGEPGKGYKVAIETLNEGRIGIGAQMVGLAQGALNHALSHARERKQFGQAIGNFQGVQFALAECAVEIECARLLVYNAARLRDAGQDFVHQAAMAKYHASVIAENVASRAIEILGGVGFSRDYPVEKLYRDAKIGRIYEGTSNMQRIVIAKHLLR